MNLRPGWLPFVMGLCVSACGRSHPRQVTPAPQFPDGGLRTSCGALEEEVAIPSANHVSGEVDYADAPPVGGDHNICWAAWGAHAEAVPAERWVHNLEHGGVVYLYHCDPDCDAEVAQLAAFVDGRTQALLSPYDALPKRFAVVAWGRRLVSDCYDRDVFEAFYALHVDRAPESVTSGPSEQCQ